MVRPSIVLTGVFKNSAGFFAMELIGAIKFSSPIRMLPAGDGWLFLVIAKVISSGLNRFACMACGSMLIRIVRLFPPNGAGAVIPGIVTNMGRILVNTNVCISVIERCGLSKTNCPTGKELPSKRTTIGGTAPGGKNPIALLTCVDTSPAACAISVPG
ncbi:hypothetical protein D3C87_1579070 [compost metagenome]